MTIAPGRSTEHSARGALSALERVKADLQNKALAMVVTAPIAKAPLQEAGFEYGGQTEFFGSIEPNQQPLMILASEVLKVGLVTGHIPLREVASTLTRELLERKYTVFYQALEQDFGFLKPRIGILGLNPHAGEQGKIGSEEVEWMQAFIAERKERGEFCFGPLPADGLFGSGEFRKLDGILALYHDQGLIPFKLMAFSEGVNFTSGLSFIRTSPDHGTAFSIAGKRVADPTSFRSATTLALEIYRSRKTFKR
jgi:4-hydroxythreonine-4-phosphate dehydrogenase